MARTRSTSAETESLDAAEAVAPTDTEALDALPLETTAFGSGKPEVTPSLPELQSPLVDALTSLSSPVQTPERPGLVMIRNGEAMRHVHPVDVAEWLELGWHVHLAGSQSI